MSLGKKIHIFSIVLCFSFSSGVFSLSEESDLLSQAHQRKHAIEKSIAKNAYAKVLELGRPAKMWPVLFRYVVKNDCSLTQIKSDLAKINELVEFLEDHVRWKNKPSNSYGIFEKIVKQNADTIRLFRCQLPITREDDLEYISSLLEVAEREVAEYSYDCPYSIDDVFSEQFLSIGSSGEKFVIISLEK